MLLCRLGAECASCVLCGESAGGLRVLVDVDVRVGRGGVGGVGGEGVVDAEEAVGEARALDDREVA
eukprot:4559782-Pleurochrysis_carterae.AAC.1